MDPNGNKSAKVGDDLAVPLESILRTDELSFRPSRPPNHQTENRALVGLAKAFADAPGTMLQVLADTVLEVLQADSAGISLLTTHDGGARFHWPAIAGVWEPYRGRGTPRDFGPCGDVLDRNGPLLFTHFERRYPYLTAATPAAEEALVLPFYVQGKAVGTIWALIHDSRRRFDAEDLRQLESLGRFASAGYQGAGLVQGEGLRRAALNLMEDAVQARDAAEALNLELGATQKELRRNAETFSRLIERAPFGIYTVDSAFRIAQVNAGAEEVFAHVQPLIGRDFGEAIRIIWPEPFASEVSDIFRRTLETGEPYLAPSLTAQRHDVNAVESYEWQLHRVTLPNGEPGVVCYFFDVTSLRRLEGELREAVAELADVDRRKNEFLAILAHELRNPLSPIRNAVHLLRLARGNGEATVMASDMIERQVGHMVRLVDDLLDVSRISRGKIELRREPVELSSVVRDAVDIAMPAYTAKGVTLALAVPADQVVLTVDATRMTQVLGNLLNNACKFTGSGGEVELSVERENDEVVIRVRDDGIGMSSEQIGQVFEMFVQADTSLDRSVGGLGIGLTLVRWLVELHGGTVAARSAGLGHGSEFEVRLPLS